MLVVTSNVIKMNAFSREESTNFTEYNCNCCLAPIFLEPKILRCVINNRESAFFVHGICCINTEPVWLSNRIRCIECGTILGYVVYHHGNPLHNQFRLNNVQSSRPVQSKLVSSTSAADLDEEIFLENINSEENEADAIMN